MTVKRAPTHLSAEAQRWWRRICREYGIGDRGGLLLLTVAMEAFDAMRDAQRIIAEDGRLITDKWGQKKAHPMCTIEKDSRSQMLASLKSLNLDISGQNDGPGRPPEQFPSQVYKA